jgi:hypothetical protein
MTTPNQDPISEVLFAVVAEMNREQPAGNYSLSSRSTQSCTEPTGGSTRSV